MKQKQTSPAGPNRKSLKMLLPVKSAAIRKGMISIFPSISEIIVDVPSPDPNRVQPEKTFQPERQRSRQPEVVIDPDQTHRSIFSRRVIAAHSAERIAG